MDIVQSNMNHYRQNVGMMVTNGHGQVLVGNLKRDPNVWIMPQGGVYPGESMIHAMHRELLEETGIDKDQIEVMGQTPDPIRYLFQRPMELDGKTYHGQEQTWFMLRFTGELPGGLPSDEEFSRLYFADRAWVLQHVSTYKLPVYRQVFTYFEKCLERATNLA